MQAFLWIDESPITVQDCLRYLQQCGQLPAFIGELLRQFVLERELMRSSEIQANPLLIDLAITDFRVHHKLIDQRQLEEWLTLNGQDYASFYQQVINRIKLEKLKYAVTAERLEAYFCERKPFLDQIILSRIVAPSYEQIMALHEQVKQGISFIDLASTHMRSEYTLENNLFVRGYTVSLPPKLRAAVALAKPGELIGPLELADQWALFRFEQALPASLEDDRLKHMLRDELFEHWVAEKIENLSVELRVAEQA